MYLEICKFVCESYPHYTKTKINTKIKPSFYAFEILDMLQKSLNTIYIGPFKKSENLENIPYIVSLHMQRHLSTT